MFSPTLAFFFLQFLHQAIATPILYDFYNYDADKKEFGQLFVKFTEVSHSPLLSVNLCWVILVNMEQF